jgi:hypothetical protein
MDHLQVTPAIPCEIAMSKVRANGLVISVAAGLSLFQSPDPYAVHGRGDGLPVFRDRNFHLAHLALASVEAGGALAFTSSGARLWSLGLLRRRARPYSRLRRRLGATDRFGDDSLGTLRIFEHTGERDVAERRVEQFGYPGLRALPRLGFRCGFGLRLTHLISFRKSTGLGRRLRLAFRL